MWLSLEQTFCYNLFYCISSYSISYFITGLLSFSVISSQLISSSIILTVLLILSKPQKAQIRLGVPLGVYTDDPKTQ